MIGPLFLLLKRPPLSQGSVRVDGDPQRIAAANATGRRGTSASRYRAEMEEAQLSFCVVNTEKREMLLHCLAAIAAERETLPFPTQVIVLDNASQDGSREAAQAHPTVDHLIAHHRRIGKAQADSELLATAQGAYCLLLNEDCILQRGACAALYQELEQRPSAACAGAALLSPEGSPQPCAWRFPTVLSALASMLFLHKRFVVQSGGRQTRAVDWCQSSALLVRKRAAQQVGYLDRRFFVYSDEVDFAKRLRDAGWSSIHVPQASAIHHEQLANDAVPQRRIVEFSRNRDLYVKTHHSAAYAFAFRLLTAAAYALRALLALGLASHSSRRYLTHVLATLFPTHGAGIREAAEAFNARLDREAAERQPRSQ